MRYIVSRRASHFSVADLESPGCKAPNSFSKVRANCHEVSLRRLDDIDTRVPLCVCVVESLCLHPDLTAHHGVVCTVVRACVENVLDSSTGASALSVGVARKPCVEAWCGKRSSGCTGYERCTAPVGAVRFHTFCPLQTDQSRRATSLGLRPVSSPGVEVGVGE